MTAIDATALRRHIGTRIVEEDVATEAPLKAIAATFDRQEDAPREGQDIPPGWHIGYFLSTACTAALGPDGTATGAGVLPNMPLPQRMYAGARITFHAPMRVGDRLRRETELTDLQVREGSTGTLIVTTQTRRTFTPRGLAMTEQGDTVFREEANLFDTAPFDLAGRPTKGGVGCELRAVTPAGTVAMQATATLA